MVGIIDLRRGRSKKENPALADDVVAATRAGVSGAVAEAEKRALSWSRGEDEQVVATALTILTRYGWTAVHDVHWPGRPNETIGHIAIGPGGIVVVDEKDWDGSVSVDDGVLRHRGYRCERDIDRLEAACSALGSILASDHRAAVSGVICVTTRDLPAAQASGVLVVGRMHLARALVDLPPRLTALDVADITRELGRSLVGRPAVPIDTGGRSEVYLPTSPLSSEPSDYFDDRSAAPCWPGDEPPAPPRTGPREESAWPAPSPAPAAHGATPGWPRRGSITPVAPTVAAPAVTPLAAPARGGRRGRVRPDVIRLGLALLAAVVVGQNNMEIASAVTDWLDPDGSAVVSTEFSL